MIPWSVPRDPELQEYLESTPICDSDNPQIQKITREVVSPKTSPKEAALRIFYLVVQLI